MGTNLIALRAAWTALALALAWPAAGMVVTGRGLAEVYVDVREMPAVKPGDRLDARIRVLETTPSKSRPDRGIVKTEGQLTNQDGDWVMTLRAVNFFGRRPGSR